MHGERCDFENPPSRPFFNSQPPPRISLRDPQCHASLRNCFRQNSKNKLSILEHQQRSLMQTYFFSYPQHLCDSDILFGCIPNERGRGMMLVLPSQRLS